MSTDKEVTPRLRKCLKDTNLVKYAAILANNDFGSTETINHLPAKQDENLCSLLNITGVDQIKMQTMFNRIRSMQFVDLSKCKTKSPSPKKEPKIERIDTEIPVLGQGFDSSNHLSNDHHSRHNSNSNTNIDLNARTNNSPMSGMNDMLFNTLVSHILQANNNSNNNSNNNVNINAVSGSNHKFYREMCAKYGTKDEYMANEKIRFFIPRLTQDNVYEMLIGVIKSKNQDNTYEIMSTMGNNIYKVTWQYILKFDENNNNNKNNKNKNNNKKNNKNNNNNDDDDTSTSDIESDDLIEMNQPIEQAASTQTNHIKWKKWERKFVRNAYDKCNGQTDTEAAIKISHQLEEYTDTKRKKNDPQTPWRTSKAVQKQIGNWKNKLKIKEMKRKRKTLSSANRNAKRRRHS